MVEVFDVLDSHGGLTSRTATREECHNQGLWHRAIVVFIISKDGQRVLLQKRSNTKRTWPNMWDVAVGGHVDAGEFSYQAAIRETKEELGIDLRPSDLIYIGGAISEHTTGEMHDCHFNDYYITYLDIDTSQITLDPDEVQDIKWISIPEFEHFLTHDTTSITDKPACWNYYLRYLQSQK